MYTPSTLNTHSFMNTYISDIEVIPSVTDFNIKYKITQIIMLNTKALIIAITLKWLANLNSAISEEDINPKDDRKQRILVSKTINETAINEFARIEDIRETKPLPVSIEVKLGSTLSVDPGTPGVILFEVTNNKLFPLDMYFNIKDNYNYIRRVFPLRASLSPGSTVLVKVQLQGEVGARGREGSPDIVTLTAEWRSPLGILESVTKHVYFYLETQQYDGTKPYIWYEYAGDCSGSVTPQNCHAKTWKVEITVQDSTSGLLSFKSDPVGLILRKEFIVGTKDQISGYYVATCCETKVDITATDTLGNTISKTIDIEKKWLNAGEISAIVLGCVLLLIIIILIIVGIVSCLRRRRRTLNIYPNHRTVE